MKLDKYSIYILIIIGIVATVALVGSISNSDLAGEAVKKLNTEMSTKTEYSTLAKQASLGEAFSIPSTEVLRKDINQMFSNDGEEYSLNIDQPIYA